MNSDMLTSIEDADLDNVAGGAGISIDLGRLGGASINVDEGGVTTTLKVFHKTFTAGLNFFFGVSR